MDECLGGALEEEGVDTTHWLLTCCPERSSTGCTGLVFESPLLYAPRQAPAELDRTEWGGQGKTVREGTNML